MKQVGIEAISGYGGAACVDANSVLVARGMDPRRAANFMVGRKTVALPGEDVISCAVNAAAPLLAQLNDAQRQGIELLVIATESGVDYSKSVGTWVHELLALPQTCRLYEIKQACYAGLGALQLAAAQIATAADDNASALVIASDVPNLVLGSTPANVASMAESGLGAGAVALLVSKRPELAVAELGAAGYHSYNVEDYARPSTSGLLIDPDLSLVCYTDCLRQSTADYARRRPGLDFFTDFQHLAFHAPVPAVVRGAHRALLRSLGVRSIGEADEDFALRLEPSLHYPREIGNIWAGTTLLALASVLDHAKTVTGQRVGLYSYGSGCSSEFSSYLIGRRTGQTSTIADELRARTEVDIDTYDRLIAQAGELTPGLADYSPDLTDLQRFGAPLKRELVALAGIRGHRRQYTRIGGAS